MDITKIVDDIYRLSVNVEGEGQLFEGIWPIPDGVSINGYLIKGEKNVLIDLTQDILDFPVTFCSQLEQISLTVEDIDIIVVNHMEPDHTGWLGKFCAKNQHAVIYCTQKAVRLLREFCGIPKDRVVVISDGMTLDLGEYVLQFFNTTNVHWPETMMTYEQTRHVLFSCDVFGSYGKTEPDGIFDDQLSSEQMANYEKETLRYFANIMASFSHFIPKAIQKTQHLAIETICPSHGIVWRENPQKIIDLYSRFASYGKEPAEKEVTLIWGSMYGNTGSMIETATKTLAKRDIPTHIYRVPEDDISFILADAWQSRGLIFAMPTYEYKMFPPVARVIAELMDKKVKNKKVFRFGSYGWIGGAQKNFKYTIKGTSWEMVGYHEYQGAPSEKDRESIVRGIEKLCDAIEDGTA